MDPRPEKQALEAKIAALEAKNSGLEQQLREIGITEARELRIPQQIVANQGTITAIHAEITAIHAEITEYLKRTNVATTTEGTIR